MKAAKRQRIEKSNIGRVERKEKRRRGSDREGACPAAERVKPINQDIRKSARVVGVAPVWHLIAN